MAAFKSPHWLVTHGKSRPHGYYQLGKYFLSLAAWPRNTASVRVSWKPISCTCFPMPDLAVHTVRVTAVQFWQCYFLRLHGNGTVILASLNFSRQPVLTTWLTALQPARQLEYCRHIVSSVFTWSRRCVLILRLHFASDNRLKRPCRCLDEEPGRSSLVSGGDRMS